MKRAMVLTMDQADDQKSVVKILTKHLIQNELLSSEQLQLGLEKFHGSLSDLTLDAPTAPQYYHEFVTFTVDEGLIPADFAPR
jgi:hypothetical protein